MSHAVIKRSGIILATLFLSACVYTNISIPLDNDLNNTHLGNKIGKASSYGILWMVAWGDAGTRAAAENGQITTVNHADREFYSVFFGAYTKVTTIVYGE